MEIEFVHDIIEDNGRSIKENNLAKQHKYPVGSLVEVKYDMWFGGGACKKVHARLWVVKHTRDCDGTPMYTLGELNTLRYWDRCSHGHGEDNLTKIEITKDIEDGEGALVWPDDTKEDR